MLRVLFNVNLRGADSQIVTPGAAQDGGARRSMEPVMNLDEEEEKVFRDMMDMAHTLITIGTESKEHSQSLTS